MMSKFNEDLKPGDRIMLYHMEDIRPILPGTKGTVKSVNPDPFEPDQVLVSVNWDDGRTLSLISGQDVWKKIEEGSSQVSSSKIFILESFTFSNFL